MLEAHKSQTLCIMPRVCMWKEGREGVVPTNPLFDIWNPGILHPTIPSTSTVMMSAFTVFFPEGLIEMR